MSDNTSFLETGEKDKCTGCSACSQICPTNSIQMVADDEGFLYPIIDLSTCIHCNQCIRICPETKELYPEQVVNQTVFSAWIQNMNDRIKSSSGGVFTALAQQVIHIGGVVYAALMSDDCYEVYHSPVASVSALEQARGSKYLQSRLGTTFRSIREQLNNRREVMFVGLPCQVAGLRSFLGERYDNLTCVDLVCHGVPSPGVWTKYAKLKEMQYDSKIEKVSFRDKTTGWRRYSISLVFSNAEKYIKKAFYDPYIALFLRGTILRPRCYKCIYKNNNYFSDITLGDLWGADAIRKTHDLDQGISLVIVRSDRGNKTIKSCFGLVEDRRIISLIEVVKKNPSIVHPASLPAGRAAFFAIWNKSPERCFSRNAFSISYLVRTIIGELLFVYRNGMKKIKVHGEYKCGRNK